MRCLEKIWVKKNNFEQIAIMGEGNIGVLSLYPHCNPYKVPIVLRIGPYRVPFGITIGIQRHKPRYDFTQVAIYRKSFVSSIFFV